ncbi:MAG: FHA domain-containing protein [Anaerolineaceae bacterium]|nr:MAG: FHA domain-containing protein [Anaerolineaceae bacterium]
MAYGRLDVYWPNGEFKSFLLEADNTSIGRSSGCTVVLDTDTISRYHTRLQREDERTFIADMESANGTFVDGVQVPNGESREMFGGEEIQIGQLRIIYIAADDQPTVRLQESEETQRYERGDHGLRVDVVVPETGIPPGSHKSVEINISNVGDEEQTYHVSVTGLPSGWGRVNRPTVRVLPDDVAQVLLNIKPPRQFDSSPGDYPLTVIVAPSDDPDKAVEAYALVEILPYNAFAMALTPRRVTLYDRLSVVLYNQGSAPLPVQVAATSADDALIFDIESPQRTLAPDERVTVRGEIRARRRHIIGQPREYPFDVLVRSRDAAGFLAAMRGKFVEDALLPRWSGYAIGGLVLGVVMLLAFALALILQIDTARPAIAQFDADAVQITSDQRLGLRWQAQNAASYTVRVNGVDVLANLPASTVEASIDAAPYAGQRIEIELIANGENRSDSAFVSVQVLPGLRRVAFDIQPSVLVRHVITSISLGWQIDGALRTELEGASAIRRAADVPVEVESSYGASAELSLQGYVTDDFSLTLIAHGVDDLERRWSLNVDVIDPTCAPTLPEFKLYERPDTAANVVRTYGSAPVDLIVDRIDPTQTWLRVRIEGGQRAWGQRAELNCEDTFRPEDLLIEVPQMPEPTQPPPTPVPTPTEDAE